eukprot:11365198-Prorocentrum_lima.AAC.1
MTSSLVGSEMCIRDSLCSCGASVWGTWVVRARHVDAGGAPSQHSRQSAATVSYTHLTLPTICSV